MMIRMLSWFALLIVCCAATRDSATHPLGNFSLNHYNLLEIQPGGLLSVHTLDFAEIPSFNELGHLDADNDLRVTPEEMREYRERLDDRFGAQYAFAMQTAEGGEVPLESRITDREVIFHYGNGGLTCMIVILTMEHRPQGQLSAGEYTLLFEDRVLTHVRGKQEVIFGFTAEAAPTRISTPGGVAPGRFYRDEPIYEGLRARVDFRLDAPFDADSPIERPDYRRFIHPASIPQFPLERQEDGSYRIVRVPVQPQREVQERIALLQPRGATGVEGMLGAMGQAPLFAEEGWDFNESTPTRESQSAFGGEDDKSDEAWIDLIGAQDLSPMLLLFILGASILFGAAHALSPGHGKTVVAAYLVGSRGTVWHAIFLGVIVTMTHVSSVLMIGVITLYFSQYVMPETLYPIMEGASGVLIILIGASIFLSRYGAYQRMKAAEALGVTAAHHHDHSHHDHGHHDHGHHDHGHHDHGHHDHGHHDHGHHDHGHHDHGHHDHGHHDHGHHDHGHHEHGHHEHGHHEHGHGHTGQHGHGIREWLDHDHSHGPHGHTHEIPADANWRDLLVLGVTGGIVPCPSAVVVLLAAIALKRLALGLIMILFFSIGLATVLIMIGILVVKAKSLIDRFGETGWMTRWLQIASPIIVMLLGVVILLRGLQSGGVLVINL